MYEKYVDRYEMSIVDASGQPKDAVYGALIAWATNNPDCQAIYLGAHGFNDRLGPTATRPTDDEGIPYAELWHWLQQVHRHHRSALKGDMVARNEIDKKRPLSTTEGRLDLWLGACQSVNAVNCWSPLTEQDFPRPLQSVVAFAEDTYPRCVLPFLGTLLETQSLSPLVWSEEVWERLLQTVPKGRPEVYNVYPHRAARRWVKPYGF